MPILTEQIYISGDGGGVFIVLQDKSRSFYGAVALRILFCINNVIYCKIIFDNRSFCHL